MGKVRSVSADDQVFRKAPIFTALDDETAQSLRASMDHCSDSQGIGAFF
jgi:hypothetical protein